MRYRKLPVEIEAEQFATVNNPFDCIKRGKKDIDGFQTYYIETLEGPLQVHDGDYVIEGVKGEHYACREDIFNMTYEAV